MDSPSVWIEFIKVGGPLILVIAIGAYVLIKVVFPMLNQHIERVHSAREKDLDRFGDAIKITGERQVEAIKEMTQEIKRLGRVVEKK